MINQPRPHTSLWHLTAPTIQVAQVGLDPPARCDTVVVGGGITGLTTAVLLSRAGQQVTLIEARTLGAVATGNTTAKLSLLQGSTLSTIHEQSGAQAVHAYLEANREGQAWLTRELTGTPHAREAMRHAPAFTYAVTADGAHTIEQEYDIARQAGLPVDLLRVTDLPFDVTAAIRLNDQTLLHPMHVLAALAEEFQRRGGVIAESCRLTDYSETDDTVRLETEQGDLEAHALVLATGTPALDKLVFSTRIVPSRSYAAAYEVPQSAIPEGMYVSVDVQTRSLRPATSHTGAPLLVVGGESHITGRRESSMHPFEELDQWTTRHFGEVARVASWGAQDYRLSGGVPFAGRIPGHDRVFAATGYNKWGMTNGVAAAHAVVSEMLGEPRGWAEELGRHFGDAPETLRTVSQVAGHLVKDWLEAETTPASDADELQDGEGVVVREGMTPVAVSRTGETFCRVSGVCTHLGGVLNWNREEQSWDCPLHGSRFSAAGEVLEGPAAMPLEPLGTEERTATHRNANL